MINVRFCHALPNAWFPVPGKTLVIQGVTPDRVADICKSPRIAGIISHVRYEDHTARISKELGIELAASGINAPNPFNSKDIFVVAALTPGTTQVQYLLVCDGTDVLKEAGIWF